MLAANNFVALVEVSHNLHPDSGEDLGKSRKDKGAFCGLGEWLRSPEVGFQSCQRNLQRKKIRHWPFAL